MIYPDLDNNLLGGPRSLSVLRTKRKRLDSTAAAAKRKKAYAGAAKQAIVAASHLSFPGIGGVRAEGKGYVWIPVNYLVVR